jgi:excisionase family DNA binding protein
MKTTQHNELTHAPQGVLVVSDEQPLPPKPLPETLTPEWLSEYVRDSTFGIISDFVSALKRRPELLRRLVEDSESRAVIIPSGNRWLTTRQAAAYLGMSQKTLRRAAGEGRIPGHKNPADNGRGTWKFKCADLDRWLKKQKTHRQPRKVSIYK